MKLCSKCNKEPAVTSPGYCRSCYNEYMREYNARPENKAKIKARRNSPAARRKAKASYLARKYGLSVPRFEEILQAQDNKCAICYREVVLVVDHCHESGEVRGLLCHLCNRGLGCLGDDPERVRQAADYLEGSHAYA